MGFINKIVSTKVAEKYSVLDDMLDSVVKNLDSSSNAGTCIIKLLYDLFVRQRQ